MADILVVSAIAEQKLLVFAKKQCRLRAPFVPYQHRPSPGSTNTNELPPRTLAIKPVGCLGGSHQVDAAIGESSCFCRALDAGELRIHAQKFFAGLAHLGIRFDAENAISIFQ